MKTDCDIIVTVVTRLELLRIKDEIRKLDPKAFMFIQYIKEESGGILRNKQNILKGTNYVTRFNEESEYLYPILKKSK
jgi:hypothetical protein